MRTGSSLPVVLAESLLEHAPVMVLRLAPDGALLEANAAARAALGWPWSALEGQGWLGTALCPGTRPRLDAALARFVAGRAEATAELGLTPPDGGERRVRWRLQRVDDDSAALLAWGEDLTELRGAEARLEAERSARALAERQLHSSRAEAEAALFVSQQHFEALVRATPVGVMAADTQGQGTFFNPRWCELTGRPPEELRELPWLDLIHPADQERVLQELVGCVGEQAHRVEFRLARPDGKPLWVLLHTVPMRDPLGEVIGHIATLTDVHSILLTRERLYAAQHIARIGVWERDLHTGLSWWSEEMLGLFGVPDEGPLAPRARFYSRVHPEDLARVEASEQQALTAGASTVSFRLVRADGEIRHVVTDARLERDPEGCPVRLLGSVQDMTERVVAEARCRRQSGLLDYIFEHSLDPMALMDREFRFLRVTESYARSCGRPVEALLGRGHFELFPSDFEADAVRVRETRLPYHVLARPFTFPDHPEWGLTFWDVGLIPVLDPEGQVEALLLTLKDVTAGVRHSQEISEARDLLRTVLDSSPDWIFATCADGRLLLVNQAFADGVGRRPEGLLGQPVGEVLPPEFVRLDPCALQGQTFRRAVSLDTLCQGEPRVMDAYTRPLRNSRGEPYGVLTYARDITEAHHAHAQLRAGLHERETLLREIHHRVKNNLQVVSSLVQVHARRVSSSEDRAALLDLRTRLSAMRLVHERLVHAPNLAEVPVAAFLSTLITEVRSSCPPPPGVRVEASLADIAVPADVALPMGMIVTELLSNAFTHAFPGRCAGHVRVEVRPAPERGVDLIVRDDGVGCSASAPGVQGFGSELVHALVDQLDGTMERGPGPGTHVRVRIPP